MIKYCILTFKWLCLFLISSFLIFLITRLMPVTPMEMLLSANQLPHTPENIALLSREWGLDQPLYLQYGNWILHFVRGDWGRSLSTGRSVGRELLKRMPYSLIIGLGGILLSVPLSFILGFMAVFKGRGWDFISRFISLLNQTVPAFILSLVVIYFLGVKLRVVRFFTGNTWFPVAAAALFIAFYSAGALSRVAKKHFLEVMEETYTLRLLSHGFSPEYVLLRHGFKPVLYGLNAALISRFASVLGGATVVEFAFGIPGINFFLVESIFRRDYTVIQSYMLLVMVWMFLVHLAFEVFQSCLDVRRRVL